MLDLSEDFIVFDETESCTLRKVRAPEDQMVDFNSGTFTTGIAQHDEEIPLESCLVRLVSNRDNALVKQVFQRGVALAALDFSVVDTIIEVYNSAASFDLEDIVTRVETQEEFVVIAYDFSHVTRRSRLACRRNR